MIDQQELQKLLDSLPKLDDDRCLCDRCQVVYVRDVIAGKEVPWKERCERYD